MEVVKKPPCKFGAKCYRKNPKHFDIYSHPESSDAQPDVKRTKNKASHRGNQLLKKVSSEIKKTYSSSVNEVKCNSQAKTTKALNVSENLEHEDLYHRKKSISEVQKKISLEVIKDEKNKTNMLSNPLLSKSSKSIEETIKMLFLVDMPHDFYSFFEFYENVIQSHHLEALQMSKLTLVGAFDVLSGDINYSVEQDLYLCHWRFFYDPPEFQTVLATDSGFHFGYWRDDPKESPVFLASNDHNKNCIFKMEAENIFGCVFHYLNEFVKTCDPFKKVKITKLQSAVKDWANKNKFSLEKKNEKVNKRQKKIVSKTFHQIGIVVPLDSKTDLGYRPLIESDENLKRICNLIMNASDDTEKETLWENLQPLITAANIANDECDFGNSLELGINLFCMGSTVFHETIKHLLCTAYSLLNRTEFEKIIEAHLKFRRRGLPVPQ